MATIVHQTMKGKEIADFLGKLRIDPNRTFDIQIEEKTDKAIKGKWAKVAEELAKEGHLDGIEGMFLDSASEFRHNLELKEPFAKTNG